MGLLGEGRGRREERGGHVPGDARPGRHVPGDARPRRSFPPRPLELGIGTARQPQLERGGTAGDQDLRGSVAVTAAIPSSGFVYKGKGNMCLV